MARWPVRGQTVASPMCCDDRGLRVFWATGLTGQWILADEVKDEGGRMRDEVFEIEQYAGQCFGGKWLAESLPVLSLRPLTPALSPQGRGEGVDIRLFWSACSGSEGSCGLD